MILGENLLAISNFDKCISNHFRVGQSYNNIGYITASQGKNWTSIQKFSQAIAVDFSTSIIPIRNVVILYGRTGKINAQYKMINYLLQVLKAISFSLLTKLLRY